jgi:hypothetical protein
VHGCKSWTMWTPPHSWQLLLWFRFWKSNECMFFKKCQDFCFFTQIHAQTQHSARVRQLQRRPFRRSALSCSHRAHQHSISQLCSLIARTSLCTLALALVAVVQRRKLKPGRPAAPRRLCRRVQAARAQDRGGRRACRAERHRGPERRPGIGLGGCAGGQGWVRT